MNPALQEHHFTAKGLASPAIAAEFLQHAKEETEHVDKIALARTRRVQRRDEPGGHPRRTGRPHTGPAHRARHLELSETSMAAFAKQRHYARNPDRRVSEPYL